MLAGGLLDLFIDSVYLVIFYAAILYFAIKVARFAQALSDEGGKS